MIGDQKTLIQCLSTFLPGDFFFTHQERRIQLSPAKSRLKNADFRQNREFRSVLSRVFGNRATTEFSPGRKHVVSDQINLPDTPLVPNHPIDLGLSAEIIWGKLNLVLRVSAGEISQILKYNVGRGISELP